MIFPQPKNPDGSHPKAIFDQRVTEALSNQARTISVQGQRVCRTTRGSYTIPEPSPIGSGGNAVGPFLLTAMSDDYLICRSDDTDPSADPTAFVYIGFASKEDGTGFSVKYSPGLKWIGVLRTNDWHGIESLTKDDFDKWNEWHPIFIAKENLHRNSLEVEVIRNVMRYYYYVPDTSDSLNVSRVATYNPSNAGYPGPPFDPETTYVPDSGEIVEWQALVPPWTQDEKIFAIKCSPGVLADTVNKDGKPSSATVKLMIYGRSSLWGRAWDD
jgi:hypothetical protein